MVTVRSALSAQRKSEWLQLNLLVARQEEGQVTSTPDALVTEVILEGTANATGQLSIEQPLHGAQPEESPTDEERSGFLSQPNLN